jgi:hypothetical protein
MPHGKFMEKLDKADKLLRQFPRGIRAEDFAKKLGVHRVQGYDYLHSLEVKEKGYSKNGLWYPATEKKPSRFGLLNYQKQRSETKREDREKQEKELRAAKWNYLEVGAKQCPEAKALQNWVDIEKKNRKELELDK